jgi:4-amino-4-deoxy-L-arabinose transferase-like glycosyltransferase
MKTGGRFGRALFLIVLVALAVRVAYVVTSKLDEAPAGDQVYYNAQANANAEGRWFRDFFDDDPTAEHPPLTALALTPTAWVVQKVDHGATGVLADRFTMVGFGLLVVVAIGFLGRAIAGERVGLIAAGLAAVYPNLWINDAHIMSETLATLAVALALLLTYRLWRAPTWANAVWVGLACGLATMARQELLLLVPVMAAPVVVMLGSVPARRRLGLFAALALATGIVCAPWVGWNLSRFHDTTFFSTNDGITICGANHPRSYYGSGTGLWALDCAELDIVQHRTTDRSVVSTKLRERGFDYMSDHLGRLPVVVLARIGRVWSLYAPGHMAYYNTGEGREEWVSWLGFATWWLFFPAAVFGAVLLRRRHVLLWPLLSQFVIVTITAVAIYGLIRFRIPAEVSVVVLAAVTIDWFLTRRTASAEATGERPTPTGAS